MVIFFVSLWLQKAANPMIYMKRLCQLMVSTTFRLPCFNDGPNQKNTRLTVNIDELLKTVRTSVQALPSNDLELCDLANELGIALAKSVGTDKSYEAEVLSGIKHGFDLVRKNAEADDEQQE
jgi:hypothetical protein